MKNEVGNVRLRAASWQPQQQSSLQSQQPSQQPSHPQSSYLSIVQQVDQTPHVAGVDVVLGNAEADVVVALEQVPVADVQHAHLGVVHVGVVLAGEGHEGDCEVG